MCAVGWLTGGLLLCHRVAPWRDWRSELIVMAYPLVEVSLHRKTGVSASLFCLPSTCRAQPGCEPPPADGVSVPPRARRTGTSSHRRYTPLSILRSGLIATPGALRRPDGTLVRGLVRFWSKGYRARSGQSRRTGTSVVASIRKVIHESGPFRGRPDGETQQVSSVPRTSTVGWTPNGT